MIHTGIGDCQFHDALANDEHTVAMYVARSEREGETLEDKSVLVSHVAAASSLRPGSTLRTSTRATNSWQSRLTWRLTGCAARLGTQCLRTLTLAAACQTPTV
jgi:hypothetical protein